MQILFDSTKVPTEFLTAYKDLPIDQLCRLMQEIYPQAKPVMVEGPVQHQIIDKADKIQAGGDHYKKMAVQPWHAMEAWLTPEEWRGFLKGNIIKYIARANSGKEDHDVMIEKARHYQDKLSEVLARQKSS